MVYILICGGIRYSDLYGKPYKMEGAPLTREIRYLTSRDCKCTVPKAKGEVSGVALQG
jgi:hypothetical protein